MFHRLLTMIKVLYYYFVLIFHTAAIDEVNPASQIQNTNTNSDLYSAAYKLSRGANKINTLFRLQLV